MSKYQRIGDLTNKQKPRSKKVHKPFIDVINAYKKDPTNNKELIQQLDIIIKYVLSKVPYRINRLPESIKEEIILDIWVRAWPLLNRIAEDDTNKRAFNYVKISLYYHARRLIFSAVDRSKLELEKLQSTTLHPITSTYCMDTPLVVDDQELVDEIFLIIDASNKAAKTLTSKDHKAIQQRLGLTESEYQERLGRLQVQLVS